MDFSFVDVIKGCSACKDNYNIPIIQICVMLFCIIYNFQVDNVCSERCFGFEEERLLRDGMRELNGLGMQVKSVG